MQNKIRKLLENALPLEHIEIIDESHLHAGHAEAQKSGGGHYTLIIVSPAFEGKNLIQRHRMVNAILKEEFHSTIHALKLKTLAPGE